jgi:hypothetical protein
MNKERIFFKLNALQNQLEYISERMYVPHIELSEYRELSKKKKKLKRDIDKLKKRIYNENK